MQNFSDRLRMVRKGARLTQEELAAKLGVSKGAVGNWESGANAADPQMLSKLSAILGVSEDFLSGKSQSAPAPALQENAPEYKVPMFQVEILSDTQLAEILNSAATELGQSDNDRKGKLLESIRAITNEIERRTK